MRQRLAVRTAERERALASAREAVRVREEFVSVAAHELKTPVTAMRGQAQLLLRRLNDTNALDPGRLRDSLQRIDAQSRKLARLIEQLLDAARLERGTFSIEPHTVDLRAVVQDILASSPQRQRLVTQLPTAPLLGHADEARLEHVLLNLLDNAAKFSPQGGDIEVTLEAPDAATARLSVRDHGLGIPPQHAAHIFERFHQAHGESHRSGIGLGLYIAKQIVDLHAGTIRVEFPSSGGTRFVVDLPRVQQPAVVAADTH
jgi:signal transduction histidine kinase